MTLRKLPKIEYNGYLCGTKKTAMRILNALLTAMLLTAAVAHGQNADPRPCSMRDVWRAYEAFDAAFLDPDKQIYKTDTSFPRATDRFNGAAAIWCQPIYWNMAMDACKAAERRGRKRRARRYEESARRIFEGQKVHYDDIMWWTISLARAYDLFGDEEYLRLSEESFRRVWHGSAKVGDTGSYDKEHGGMFWRWYPIRNPEPNRSGDGKMACINFPTAVAAVLLAAPLPPPTNIWQKAARFTNGAKRICSIPPRDASPTAVTATANPHGKPTYTIRPHSSEPPCCSTEPRANAATSTTP